MSDKSQRLRRGFHRVGTLLAAAPLLAAVLFFGFLAIKGANDDFAIHTRLLCAHQRLDKEPKLAAQAPPKDVGSGIKEVTDPDVLAAFQEVDLKAIGCSDWTEAVSRQDIREAGTIQFSYGNQLLEHFYAKGLVLALVLSILLYGVVRAIGWAVRGFVE